MILTQGTYLFRTPDSLCRGVHRRGFTFAAVIVRPDWRTGREDPAIPPGTIGVFEIDHFADDDPLSLTVDMREAIVQGRRVSVNGARAQSDVTGIAVPAQAVSGRSLCIPAGALFSGDLSQDVRVK